MRQFMIYLVVGVASAAIDIGTMQLLLLLETHYLIATSVGFAAGLTFNFLLHTTVTFKSIYSHGALARYLTVVLANYCLTLLAVSLFETWMQMPVLGKIISLPLVALNGYYLSKKWIYRSGATE